MTAESMRDLGDVLLRIACTYVGGLLVALAVGMEPGSVRSWGWVVAVVAVPAAYGIRRYGQAEMLADAATDV